MHLAVEGTRLIREQRGIARYCRSVLAALIRLDENLRCTLFVHPFDLDAARRQLDSMGVASTRGQVESATRLQHAKFDLFWSPWNMTDYLPRSGPVAVTIHDVVPLVYPDRRWRKARRRKDLENAFHRMAAAADLVLTDSEFSRGELQRWLEIPAERIQVTPLGVDRFTPGDPAVAAAWLREFGLSPTTPYLLHVGSGERRKNIPRLFQALELLRSKYGLDCRLVLAGPCDSLEPLSYRRIVDETGTRDAIYFACGFDDAVLQALYRAAHALVFPSLYEGFGLPVIEAMASGIPVVASRASSIPEVGGGAALYFDPENVQEMADQLRRVVTDESLRKALVAKGLHQAARFSWEDTARRTGECFRVLVGAGGAARR